MSAPNKARLVRFNELLAKAKALDAGDDETLREIIKAAVDSRLSDTQIESLVAAGARKASIAAKAAQAFVKEAREALKKRDANEPAAKAEKKRLGEAAAKAAKIAREAETEHLYTLVKDLAESPTLLSDMQKVAHRLGVVNEDEAIASAYLACTSRLLKRQAISYLRRGAAASGKNHLLAQVLKLFPKDCVIPISSATPMALIYFRGDEAAAADAAGEEGDENALAHRIILIAEAAILSRKANGEEHPMTGMLRVLLSDGRLDHLIPLPSTKGGAPKTVHIKRNGPVVLLLTSARQDIEPEMMTRLLSSDADESHDQTRDVIAHILKPAADPIGQAELAKWVNFQAWLEHDAPYEVVIPFLKAISDAYLELITKFPATLQLRMRRDVSALVTAVEASAVVHRAQRKTDKAGRIIAELEDYAHAHGAFGEGQASLYDMRPAAAIKATLSAVIAIAEEAENAGVADPALQREYDSQKSYRITVEAVRKKLGVASKETAAQRMEKLVDFGFIEEDESRRGKGRGSPRFYTISDKATGGAAPNVFPHPVDVARKTEGGGVVKTPVQDIRDEQKDGDGVGSTRTSSTSCTGVFTTPPPTVSSSENSAKKRGNGQKPRDLTASERIAATREGGGTLAVWADGSGFDVDLRGVLDPLLRDMLLAAISTRYGAVLDELKSELGQGKQAAP